MKEIRIITVDRQEVPVLISDEKEALLAAKAAGRAIVGLWDPENPDRDLGPAVYLTDDPDTDSGRFLERVARRHLGLPWIICETQRLRIRELTEMDFEVVRPYGKETGFPSKQRFLAYIKNQYRFYGFGLWALEERTEGVLVGLAGLTAQEKAEGDERVWEVHTGPEKGESGRNPDTEADFLPEALEIGYFIFPDRRRQGYAKEACRAILDRAGSEQGIWRVTARISRRNTASEHLAEELGMTPENRRKRLVKPGEYPVY